MPSRVYLCVPWASALTVALAGPARVQAEPAAQELAVDGEEPTAEPEPEAGPEPEPEPETEPGPKPEAEPEPDDRARAAPPTPTVRVPPPPTPFEVDPVNYRMVLAGDIVIGLGGAGFITMAVGLGIRSDAVARRQALTVSDDPDLDAIAHQEQRARTGSMVAITGGAAAAVLLATGITLVARGYKRERERRASLPTATLGPEGAAVVWSLRF